LKPMASNIRDGNIHTIIIIANSPDEYERKRKYFRINVIQSM